MCDARTTAGADHEDDDAVPTTSDSEFQAALSSAELFRQLLESAPDAIVGIGRDGRIAFVNAQTEKLFGYARDELIGEHVEKLVPERYHGAHGGHRSGYFTDPRTRPMGAGLDLYGLRSDGSEFPAEISLSSIETPDGLLATAAIRDITDRKKAEAKFQQLLESAPDAIVGIDRDGRIGLVNAQTEKLFGYARDELIGEPVEKLVPERYHGAHSGHRSGYFTDPRTRPMGAGLDLYGLRSDGSEFPAEISLSSIETEDGLLATAAIRDITDRKHAERDLARHAAELQRSNVELSQYAYVASHDLQEPLRMVVTYTDRLGEHLEGTARAARPGVGRLRRRGRHADAVAHRGAARVLARASRGGRVRRDRLRGRPAARAGQPAGRRPRERRADHARPAADDLRRPVQLLQLFQNLIGNALKFRGDDAPVVHLGCAREGGDWHFSVADNGIGIDAARHRAHLRALPAPALQGRLRRRRHRAGALQEDRRRAPRPDLGAVRARRRRDVPLAHARRRSARAADDAARDAVRTILVIEDNAADAGLVADALDARARRRSCSWPPAGTTALALLRGRGYEPLPDLILLDLNLPGYSGLETLADAEGRRRAAAASR